MLFRNCILDSLSPAVYEHRTPKGVRIRGGPRAINIALLAECFVLRVFTP